jgi:hypothetical protein
MKMQELVDRLLELSPNHNAEVWMQCPSFGPNSSMFQEIETVEINNSGTIILNAPGLSLPHSVAGTRA